MGIHDLSSPNYLSSPPQLAGFTQKKFGRLGETLTCLLIVLATSVLATFVAVTMQATRHYDLITSIHNGLIDKSASLTQIGKARTQPLETQCASSIAMLTRQLVDSYGNKAIS